MEYLNAQPSETLERSPTLALQYGIALARVGTREAGERWVAIALDRARERGDLTIEAWALNVSGVIALEATNIRRGPRPQGYSSRPMESHPTGRLHERHQPDNEESPH